MTKKERDRLYYLKNRERILNKSKEYTLLNKDRKREYDKEYRAKNKDKRREWRRKRAHEPIVYLLVNENYVGVTNNLKSRLRVHKNYYKRDTSEVIELAKFKNREEALLFEAALQLAYGYKGFNPSQIFNL